MSASFATVKLTRPLVEEARREADLFHRSLGGQIEHWATLGRAVENGRDVSVRHVRQSLAGEPPLEAMSALEQDAALDRLGEAFAAPSQSVREQYRELGARLGAVGTDANGVLSKRGESGAVEPV